ncbi:hypothetical protein FQR65_LT04377 [Abscondita terminalis]|nr:hypothetical protein FQR65_LT04377 [Abscondita terminalis]
MYDNNHFIKKHEESDISEDSWSNTYSTDTDSSSLYVNNMNQKNEMSSREVILAGLQSVIDMCTPTDSVSDAEDDLKKSATLEERNYILKRRGILQDIKNLVEKKSQLDIESGLMHTVQGKNEVMIMSFIRPEIVSVNHNRLRAGARESSSRSVYSKYSQTQGLNVPENLDSETCIKLGNWEDNKNSSVHNLTKHEAPNTLFTTGNKFHTSTSSSMQSKNFFKSFSGSYSSETKYTDTEIGDNTKIKNFKDHQYICGENDGLPLNAKVSTISTNNLKVIHISLGANTVCKQKPEPICFKCLKTKKSCKKKAPKLCLNAFASITGKAATDGRTATNNLHYEHKTVDQSESVKKTDSDKKILKEELPEKENSLEPLQLISNKSKENQYCVKSESSENCSDIISTESSIINAHKRSSRRQAKSYQSTSSTKTEDTIFIINCEVEKSPDMNIKCEEIVKDDSKNSSKHSQSSNNNEELDDSKKTLVKMTGDSLTNQKRKLLKKKSKSTKNSQGQALLKKNSTLTEENAKNQKAALESIKEQSENITVSTNRTVRIPSNKTIILSNRDAIEPYHVETQNYLALNKGPHGDNALLEIKKQSSSRNKSLRRRSSKKICNEEILKKKESLDNFFVNNAVQQKIESSSDESHWQCNIPQIAKQINAQLYPSESDDDSMKTRCLELNVENLDGIDIVSEKAAVTTECRRKNEKKFSMAQFFGHTPEPCDCKECVKNRPMEIRYATTKISKFQQYSTFEIEKFLLCITFIVVTLSIILSLCIGLVLPPYFMYNYSNNNLFTYCICEKSEKLRELNCHPETLLRRDDNVSVDIKTIAYHQNYSYLVSLFINAYNDDDYEKRFSCTGVIITYNWILTGQDCVIEYSEWLHLQVRAGSMYWSKEGTLHDVEKVIYFYKKGPVGLRIYPNFRYNKLCNPIKLSKTFDWKEAFSGYWKNTKNKSEIYVSDRWTKTPLKSYSYVVGELRNEIKCDVTLSGKPLVVDKILVGFQIGSCLVKNEFVYQFIDLQNSEYASWLEHLIKHGEPYNYTVSARRDDSVTYIYKMIRKCSPNNSENNYCTNVEATNDYTDTDLTANAEPQQNNAFTDLLLQSSDELLSNQEISSTMSHGIIQKTSIQNNQGKNSKLKARSSIQNSFVSDITKEPEIQTFLETNTLSLSTTSVSPTYLNSKADHKFDKRQFFQVEDKKSHESSKQTFVDQDHLYSKKYSSTENFNEILSPKIYFNSTLLNTVGDNTEKSPHQMQYFDTKSLQKSTQSITPINIVTIAYDKPATTSTKKTTLYRGYSKPIRTNQKEFELRGHTIPVYIIGPTEILPVYSNPKLEASKNIHTTKTPTSSSTRLQNYIRYTNPTM